MGEDPERIEQEIEHTRAKLGEDLDALEDRVNPKKVAHRSVDKAKEKVAAAAAAAKEKAAAAREKATAAKEKATSGGSDAPAASGSGGVGEKVSGLAGTAREKVGPLATSVKEKAAARSGVDPQTADNRELATAVAGTTWSTLLEQTRRNPLAVGAVAFVIGVVLGH